MTKSAAAYTIPYIAQCLISTRFANSAINDVSTIPFAIPKIPVGINKYTKDAAEGT